MPRSVKFAVFVDRDGTICFDKHYLSDPNSLELIPTVAEGIRKLNEAKIPVIVVTNQSGVGRGYFSEEALTTVHERLAEMLAIHGAIIDDLFYCPHKPDEGCPCRKPAPGMLLQAKEKHGFDLKRSFVIGDRMMDVSMAHSVGALGILVPEPGDQYNIEKEILESRDRPEFKTNTLTEAVDWILKRIRMMT
jgi:D-glycero-D-manno-heptose 1,7-bisphosphate phosphatase